MNCTTNKCTGEVKYFCVWYSINGNLGSGPLCEKCFKSLLKESIIETYKLTAYKQTEYRKESKLRTKLFCEMVKSGKSNREVSEVLSIEYNTVCKYKAKYKYLFNEEEAK